MVKAVIHAELMEENGKQTISVKADGDGLDLLDMTAQIAADIIATGADGDKDLIERRKQYFFMATGNDLKNESKDNNRATLDVQDGERLV